VGPWHGGLDLLDMEKGVLDNDPLLSRLGFLLPMRGDGLDGVAHVEKTLSCLRFSFTKSRRMAEGHVGRIRL